MTTSPSHDLYVVSKTGEVHRSVNYGSTWESRGNIPVPDACAIWKITGLDFVITQSGDFYKRSDATGDWSLLGNVGASDCADLVPHPTGGFLTFTRSGDVWRVTTEPFTKSLIGNVNSSTIASAVTLNSSVLAVTDEGDVARSMDNGAHWLWRGTVSQLTVTGMTSKGTVLYLTTDAGEVMRSTDQGSNWLWCGTASQVGILGITSDSVSVISVEEYSSRLLEIFGVYPNPSHGRFTIYFRASFSGSGSMRLFDVLGREVDVLWQGTIFQGMNTVEAIKDIRGVYFLIIEAHEASAVKKVIVD
ncbi:hypothetical protein A2Y85_08660 [candidate division WOR-3 bacterium RBG_13_43_14]|uniref:Secretion system C-terminal sorting domain-containing protein n=1 Tax=candidate division WOR-3 bacterium RBG_13_43_14 TaxID=1802590 RepID=A0A1F4U2P7_UNCW3|nr:MAG: hypothetical protein A2Y85_08660 [candidate division WOR-3 bacterium RBG_13_43_14]